MIRVLTLFAKDTVRPGVEHVYLVTDDGVFERYSDEAPDKWTKMPLPTKRKRKQVKNSR